MYAFLFFEIISAQEIDTSIIISHFQYPVNEGIPIILDETGENSYFLNYRIPEFLTDGSINQIKLDGSLGLPLGSYFLPNLLPKSFLSDSMSNYSQIYYRKGDYDYSDLGIGLQIESSDSGLFSFQGFKRAPPRLYLSSSDNNQLQNYLFSYGKDSKNSNVAVSALYHIENYDQPVNLENTNRKVESFHGGAGFTQYWDKLSLNLNPAFQFTNSNRWGSKMSHLILWNKFKGEFHFQESFSLILDHNYKMLFTEFNDETTESYFQINSPSFKYSNDRIILQAGAAAYNSTITPVGLAGWKWNDFYMSVGKQFEVVLIPTESLNTEVIPYLTQVVNAGYKNDFFMLNAELFQIMFEEESNMGVRGEANINVSWLSLRQTAGIYNIESGTSHTQPVDMFSHTNLIFSPNVWRWKTARYQPFIGVESTYIQHSGKMGIDPMSWAIFSVEEIAPYSSYLLNMEIGFLVNQFKVSYRWVKFNVLDTNVQNSSNPDFYSILPLRHLEVVWQFWN